MKSSGFLEKCHACAAELPTVDFIPILRFRIEPPATPAAACPLQLYRLEVSRHRHLRSCAPITVHRKYRGSERQKAPRNKRAGNHPAHHALAPRKRLGRFFHECGGWLVGVKRDTLVIFSSASLIDCASRCSAKPPSGQSLASAPPGRETSLAWRCISG